MSKPFIVYYNINTGKAVKKAPAEEEVRIGMSKMKLAVSGNVAVNDIVAQFEYIKDGIETLGLGNACEVL